MGGPQAVPLQSLEDLDCKTQRSGHRSCVLVATARILRSWQLLQDLWVLHPQALWAHCPAPVQTPFSGSKRWVGTTASAFSGLAPTGPLCEEITSVFFLLALGAPTSLRRGDGRRCGEGRRMWDQGLRGGVGVGRGQSCPGRWQDPPLKKV